MVELSRRRVAPERVEAANSFALSLNKYVGKELNKATTPAAPVMNFSGPITIQQDFKDQDPDRVAVVFRRDLVRHATARIRANTHGGMGF